MTNSGTDVFEEELKLGSYGSSHKKPVQSTCRICLSNILDPARLGCGHRFCERCLNRYWKVSEKPEFVVCPLCRDLAYKVGFVEKKDVTSTWDFRRQFDSKAVERCMQFLWMNKKTLSTLFLKISLVITMLYIIVEYFKPALMYILMRT